MPLHAQPLYDLVHTAHHLLEKDCDNIPATLAEELKICNKRAKFLNDQLDLILPPGHNFRTPRFHAKNTKDPHPIIGLKKKVQGWLFNFFSIFARHIDAFRLQESQSAPTMARGSSPSFRKGG